MIFELGLSGLACFAISKEISELKDSYTPGIPRDSNSLKTLLRKIRVLTAAERNSVKWRRCLLLSLLIIFLIFTFVICRYPTYREFILSLTLIFMGLYLTFSLYSKFYFSEIEKISKKITEKIRDKYFVS